MQSSFRKYTNTSNSFQGTLSSNPESLLKWHMIPLLTKSKPLSRSTKRVLEAKAKTRKSKAEGKKKSNRKLKRN